MVAAGLSGPSRAAAGSVRDHVLGVTMVSGTGELMHFGGRVIKNVAGYDVSRLVAGSLGILGVIVEVSLKVLPKADAEATLRFDLDAAASARAAARLGREAAAARRQRMVERQPRRAPARLAGRGRGRRRARSAASRSRPTRRRRSGRACAITPIRSSPPRTRPSSAATRRSGACRCRRPRRLLGLAGDELIEWHGAQRWLLHVAAGARPCARRRRASRGHATVFRSPRQVGRRLRAALDAARADPRAAQALVRSEGHPQSRPPLSRPLTTDDSHPCRPTSLPSSRARADGIEAEAILQEVRALRLLHRDLPDLPAARRRARRPARPHLPHQAGARRPRADARDPAPSRPLPDLPQLRDDLPVGRAVRQPGRDRPAHRRRARAAAGRPSRRRAGR